MSEILCYFCNRKATNDIEIEEPEYDIVPVCDVHIEAIDLLEPDREDGLSYGEL